MTTGRALKSIPALLALITLTVATPAHSHRQRLDELGCHMDRQTSYYHCHEGPLEGRKFASKTSARRALRKLEKAREEEEAKGPSPLPVTVAGEEVSYGPYPATAVRVPGDGTLELDIHLWPGLTHRTRLRLDGVARCAGAGDQETAFIREWLKGADTVRVSGVRPANLSGIVFGTVAREGRDLGEALIQAGHARAGDPASPAEGC